MKTTNITVEMVYITQDVAKNYLNYNINNRLVNKINIGFIVNQMKNGTWVENGESIIFDSNGDLKDGQHRLNAIATVGNPYWYPVVRGVKPSVMATIDTGKSRTPADVLYLNGFKNTNAIASFIIIKHKYSTKKSKEIYSSTGTRGKDKLTNQMVLDYCRDNYHLLAPIYSKIAEIYVRQTYKLFSKSQLFIVLYLIAGYSPSQKHYDFLGHLCGVNKESGSAADYIFNKVAESKLKKEPLNFYWILGMSLKAWNYFADGNPSVKHFRFSIEDDLPKIIQITN